MRFMAKITRSASVDLTEGNLFGKIIKFTLPIIITGVCQLLFNTADLVVVGKFASDKALSAVGATGALINLIVNLVLGLSIGAGVLAARYFGSRDERAMHELVQTSVPVAVIGGLFFALIGFFFSGTFLVWMQTPAEGGVLDSAAMYMKIYFIGVPFSVVYNFLAAILRSVGDTTRPLIFLVSSGIINVILNLVFVLGFGIDVEGVAIATSVSQALACGMIILYMMRIKESHRLELKKLKIYRDKLVGMIAVGLPAGIQGSLFSISNVIIQSSINSFGSVAMAGNTAANNIEGYVYTCMNAFSQTAVSFVGQHVGAKKERRIKNITLICVGCVLVIGIVLGVGAYLLGTPLLTIYTNDQSPDIRDEIIRIGLMRLSVVSVTYCTCGIMDVLSGILRGMGYSTSSMLIVLICVCGIRILWIYTYFVAVHTLTAIYISYPVSWVICIAAQAVLFAIAYARMKKRVAEREAALCAGSAACEGTAVFEGSAACDGTATFEGAAATQTPDESGEGIGEFSNPFDESATSRDEPAAPCTDKADFGKEADGAQTSR